MQMRLRFLDPVLKEKAEALAVEMDVSLNMLINFIVAAQFSEEDRKNFQMMCDLAEFKRSVG
jgi:hypothetical protein